MRPSPSSDAQPLYRGPTSSRYSMVNSDAGSDTMSFSPRNSRQNSSQDLYAEGSLPVSSSAFSTASDLGPGSWGPEDDDWLHNPDKSDGVKHNFLSVRGIWNYLTLGTLLGAIIMLFGGYPIITYFKSHQPKTLGAFNLGGVNASGQVPAIVGNFGLIDADTPASAYSMVTQTGETWELVFSDEFNTAGRTFWPGDDPYWEAQDLHAWSTNDLEYYSPSAVTTVQDPDDPTNGFCRFTLSNITTHDLYFEGGEISTWNKFCFTGGRLEAAVRLPGRPDVYGLWPAVWTMGNLGRVGYGGTLEGTWPYTYDSCDSGTLSNQTKPDGTPEIVKTGNIWNEPLSYLQGQRLSACTCPDDETHPGPKKADGTWTGRSAPEIDLVEAQVDHDTLLGQVSQSCQFAPFNLRYEWDNKTNMEIYDSSLSSLNSYSGGQFQMSASVLTTTNQNCYELAPGGAAHTGCFAVFAFEYEPGMDGYITWFSNDKAAWTYKGQGMHAQAAIDVGDRPIPEEPLYIIMNLAISLAFTTIDYENLLPLMPVHMDVDYVRVYQDSDKKNIGCDPDDYPTAKYIERYKEGYSDYNITTWDQMTDNAPLPRNRLTDTC